MAEHLIVATDTEPPLEAWLDYADVPYTDPTLPALPVDATVTFVMKATGGTPITSTATVVDAAARLVRKTFTKAETATPGTYAVQWQVDYADGRRQTHPSTDTVKVLPDLGGPA